MMDTYFEIKQGGTSRTIEKSSKFFGYTYTVYTDDQAKELLHQLLQEHPKASHHCYAWRMGLEENLFRLNDDGEPSGTAARPIYNEILRSQLSNVLIVVVRYFGGKKLGTSGLKKAYQEAARQAIANSTITKIEVTKKYLITTNYKVYPSLEKVLAQLKINILHRSLTNLCTVTIEVPISESEVKVEEVRIAMSAITTHMKITESNGVSVL